MPACAYCSKPFIKTDEWHTKHPELVKHCSHGCLYAAELPNSHAGQSFVSLEAMGSELPDPVQLPHVVIEDSCEVQDVVSAEIRFVAVIELLASMNAGDRDLLLYRIHNRNKTLAEYARKKDITVQAVHRRLVKMCKKHPCIEFAISEHRYRKRAVNNSLSGPEPAAGSGYAEGTGSPGGLRK